MSENTKLRAGPALRLVPPGRSHRGAVTGGMLVVAAVLGAFWTLLPVGGPGRPQGSIPRRAASGDHVLRAVAAPGGIELDNAKLRLRARFGVHGLHLRSDGLGLGLRLTGYGYGDALHGVGSVTPRAVANRVVYSRGPLTEWYSNTPAGLEQGFTLTAHPRGRGAGPLTLALAVSGRAHTARSHGGEAITFSRGRGSVAYRGLAAVDARGTRLPARLELGGGALRLRIDDRHARYPLRIDPFIASAAGPASPYAQAVLADTPIAYYRLGEAGGATAFDSSGNGLDATYQSGAQLGTPGALLGDADTAATASGSGVMLSQSGDRLPAGRASRTLEGWVNYVCCTGPSNLFQYGDLAGGHGFTVALGDHANTITVSGASTSVSAATLAGGDGFARSGWHLVDVSYDGSTGTVEIYQDGQIIGGGPLGDAATATPGQGLQVNANYAGFRLDEVAIYGTPLSPGQIGAHWSAGGANPDLGACAGVPTAPYAATVLADAPTAYYRLDELAAHPQDRAAFDSSGHCANAAYGPGVGPSPGALIGDADTAVTSAGGFMLSGSADQLPAGNTPRTLEAWVDYVCCTGPYNLFQYGDLAGGHAFTVALGDHANTIAVSGGGTPVTASTLGGGDGFGRSGWHLVDVTYDGSTVEIYQDGQIVGGGPLGDAGTVTPGQGLQVSANYAGFRLDEVAIYPSALSSKRVNAHWVAQSLTPPGTSILGGTALLGGGGGAQGARVQACPTSGAACTVDPNAVDSSGAFHLLVADDTYTVTIFPPAGSPTGPQTIGPLTVPPSNRGLTATFAAPGGLPTGVAFSSPSHGTQQNTVPGVNWGEPSTVTTTGCKNGAGVVYVQATNTSTGQVETRASALSETPAGSGTYVAQIPALSPLHGDGSIDPQIGCTTHTQVLPTGGPPGGGTPVVLAGSGLTGVTSVKFGVTDASSFTIQADTLITAVAPPGAGAVAVTAKNSSGATLSLGNYSYFDVASVAPTSGPALGGTTVTINGHGFTAATGVMFGLMPSPSVTVVNDNQIQATTPLGFGTVNVEVISGLAVSPASPATQYTYQGGPPGASGIVETTGGGENDLHNLGTQVLNVCAQQGCSGLGYGPVNQAAGQFNTPGSAPSAQAPPPGIPWLPWVALGLAGARVPIFFACLLPGNDVICAAVGAAFVGAGLAIAAYNVIRSLCHSPNDLFGLCHLFIDPSGTVVDTSGNPINGATATILGQAPGGGGFAPVDPASGALQPATNPQTTGSSGGFDWDALAGTYEVQASAPGCHAPGKAGQASVITSPFTIPPPALGLLLALECPGSAPPPPTVTAVPTGSGPAGGGNKVEISGTGLATATAVDFAATPATQIKILSPYAIQVVAPAGTSTVDVTVTTNGGTSATGEADKYSYLPSAAVAGGPTISSLTPSGGPLSGGTPVTIHGINLDKAFAVYFGGTPSPQVTNISSTEVHAVAPATSFASRVGVSVATAAGTSDATATYSYGSPPPPTVASVTLAAVPSPVTAGAPVKVTATVAPTDGGGTLAFIADGGPAPMAGCETVALTHAGNTYTATCSTSSLAAGDHTLAAVYSGDANYATQTGSTRLSVIGVPVNTTPPSISGTVTQGQTLTETNGSWTNNPTNLSHQWQDCEVDGNNCAAIAGATSQTYLLAASDIGHTVRVQETASNAAGPGSPASSAPSGVVAAPSPTATAPANQSLPTIAGTTAAGGTLSASTGTWSGTAPISYAYRWQRCHPGCSDVAGATGASYTLTGADVGARLQVVVAASNAAGNASATSAQAGPVMAAAPTTAQIKALLLNEITPTGKPAAIAALLKAGGFTLAFQALTAGAGHVDWYFLAPGAHLAAAKPKPLLLATGGSSFAAAGTGQLKVKLTAAGRNLLKTARTRHARHLSLTAKASFTPTGSPAVLARKAFTLKR